LALSRRIVVPGMLAEYTAFAQLVCGISDQGWEKPTGCPGWTVADVAAHVVGQLVDVVGLQLDGLGTPEVTAREVQERTGRPPRELADELRPATNRASGITGSFDDAAWKAPVPGGTAGTLGFGIEALWFDTYIHADDIRDALEIPSHKGPGLIACVSHIAQVLTDQEWVPATLALEELPQFIVSGGDGRIIVGDAKAFVLVATGRGDPSMFGLDKTVQIYR
jgi:uncharacterized protein (TIGR03083 family)